jgi:hypothetical protein
MLMIMNYQGIRTKYMLFNVLVHLTDVPMTIKKINDFSKGKKAQNSNKI